MNKSKIIFTFLTFSLLAMAKNGLLAVNIKINNDTDHKVKVTAYGKDSQKLFNLVVDWKLSKTAKKHGMKNKLGIRTYTDLKTIYRPSGWVYKVRIRHLGKQKKTYTVYHKLDEQKGFTRTRYLKITGDGEGYWQFTSNKTW